MNRNKIIVMAGLAMLPLAACTTADQPMPLIFGRTQTIGIGVQGSAADQGAAVTLGFNDRNIAIVPSTTMAGEAIRSVASGEEGQQFTDALSVLGQFEANAEGANVSAGLGTFFSTGLAARNLAEGFRDKLSRETPD
jgi:hypothetical protein